MARIVYGVAGEGSGHASRAREIASHLCEQGHDLWLVSYDRGYRNLKDDFRVLEVEGLSIGSENNKVSVVRTIVANLKRLLAGHRTLQELRKRVFQEWQPDCVITDFEPMTAYLANQSRIPLITIDNQHAIRYLRYECPPELRMGQRLTKTIIRAMIPRPDVSLVTAFAPGKPVNKRTFVFPPILRREVLQLQPRDEGHVLVYVTQHFESLLEGLRRCPRETFRVYGFNRAGTHGNLDFRPFSRTGFLEDLAGAKAVIATAGFTLISEALYLRKPYLAFPMLGQFEQELNAFHLERLGYGKRAARPTSESVGDFLYRLPEFRDRLQAYQPGDNSQIKAQLDALLADNCRLARQYCQSR